MQVARSTWGSGRRRERTTDIEFRARVSAALAKRIGPEAGTGVTMKMVAHTLQVSEQTVWAWVAGTKAPSGPLLLDLVALFDASFANEIFAGTGATVVKLNDARLIRIRAAAQHALELEILKAAQAAD